jgi:hypothetical protein
MLSAASLLAENLDNVSSAIFLATTGESEAYSLVNILSTQKLEAASLLYFTLLNILSAQKLEIASAVCSQSIASVSVSTFSLSLSCCNGSVNWLNPQP